MSQDTNPLLIEVQKLRNKATQAALPPKLSEKIDEMLVRLERSAQFGTYSEEYERTAHYLEWCVRIPWDKYTKDQIDISKAKQIMDKHHYGMESVKQRILEHLSILKLNYDQNKTDVITKAPIICLVGLAGTGKTSFAFALGEAIGRKVARIPFGGMGSARDLRGQSRLHIEAEPGLIIKALVESGTSNPIFLLDEIDRVAAEARADIMGVLLALLDPSQNSAFVDHYLDYPVNLNQSFFLATSNNTDNISTAVLNRLEVIHMPTYSDEEKITIAKNYILPGALADAGLEPTHLIIPDEVWPALVRPLGFDSGIRVLKRLIDTLTRKVAYMIVTGQTKQVVIDPNNIGQFIDQYAT